MEGGTRGLQTVAVYQQLWEYLGVQSPSRPTPQSTATGGLLCDSSGLWASALEEAAREAVFVWAGAIRGRWRGSDGGGYGPALALPARDQGLSFPSVKWECESAPWGEEWTWVSCQVLPLPEWTE